MLCFAKDFPDAVEVTLLRNYRSTRFILEGAAAIMEKAEPLQSQQKDALPIAIAPCNTEKEEAEMIVEQVERMIGGTTYFSLDSGRVASHEGELSLGFGDMGVLFRLNAQGDALEEAFQRAGIPFVVSAPESTIDEATASGADIPLELRADEEVTSFHGVRAAPEGTRTLNYAFDVTPADLVTAIVTEDRVIRP